jgi:NADH-quinone oxidoreductase subunit L
MEVSYLVLIPVLPILASFVNMVFGKRMPRGMVHILACASVLGSACLATMAVLSLMGHDAPAKVYQDVFDPWIQTGNVNIKMGFVVDHLSAIMVMIVCWVGLLIHVYAGGYMEEDPEPGRFFSYLNLFMGAMLCLILGDNIILMVFGWEGVGLCSYLLIGFWWQDKANAQAGMKAFLVNRVGDWGFFLGAFLLFWAYVATPGVDGTVTFDTLKEGALAVHHHNPATVTIAILLLFVGATGKSAQIPLYVWLPDAMAGPTPVSALIHAATMVTAGVYMLVRLNFLVVLSPTAMAVIAIIGALTAVFAASIGLVQNDIKKVLAYSTVSQLGYMFLGVGAFGFVAAVFHLMTHAFFKALLFLGSGSVIHGMHHEQDMRKMGGLKKYMPITHITMFIGSIAIAGVPFFAGFYSKDEILWKTFSASHWEKVTLPVLGNIAWMGKALWAVGFVAAGMTAFYMWRLMNMTFYGEFRGGHDDHGHDDGHAHDAHHDEHAHDAHAHDDHGHHGHHEPHESPLLMTGPLMVLALLSVIGGYIGMSHASGSIFPVHIDNYFEHWLTEGEGAIVPHSYMDVRKATAAYESQQTGNGPAGHDGTEPATDPHAADPHAAAADGHGDGHHEVPIEEYILMYMSIGWALLGIGLAFVLYRFMPGIPGKLAKSFGGIYDVLLNKYYIDELYFATVIAGTLWLSRLMGAFDRVVVDGFVNGFARFWLAFSDYVGWFDKKYVDGAVNLAASAVSESGQSVQRMQSGRVKQYIGFAVMGVLFLVAVFVVWMILGSTPLTK